MNEKVGKNIKKIIWRKNEFGRDGGRRTRKTNETNCHEKRISVYLREGNWSARGNEVIVGEEKQNKHTNK